MDLDFNKTDGLVTAVIQDHTSGRVLMVGYMNEESFRLTVERGYAIFWSRSRKKLWLKGESSGHKLLVKFIQTDCDKDAVLIQVEPVGPGVCHEGYESCFFRTLEVRRPPDATESTPETAHPSASGESVVNGPSIVGEWKVTEEQTYDPATVYNH